MAGPPAEALAAALPSGAFEDQLQLLRASWALRWAVLLMASQAPHLLWAVGPGAAAAWKRAAQPLGLVVPPAALPLQQVEHCPAQAEGWAWGAPGCSLKFPMSSGLYCSESSQRQNYYLPSASHCLKDF